MMKELCVKKHCFEIQPDHNYFVLALYLERMSASNTPSADGTRGERQTPLKQTANLYLFAFSNSFECVGCCVF